MIEVHFHRDLYAAAAVSEAVETYREVARIELSGASLDASAADSAGPPHFIVRIAIDAGDDDVSEQDVAAELANYALGRSIEAFDSRGSA